VRTLLHISDVHFGPPHRPRVSDGVVELATARRPDLVILSGDLTQRARPEQFAEARRFVDRFPVPTLVVPGNHDVPLYRFWERLFSPYANWRRYVSPELDSVTLVSGATVVALNTSAPRRAIVSGRIREAQLDFAHRAFQKASEGDARIVVAHHHFVPLPGGEAGRTLPRAREILEALESMRVDLILGGHVHVTHLSTSRSVVPGDGPGIPLVACGTTASSRGRLGETGRNSYNVVRVEGETVEVVSNLSEGAPPRFVPGVRRLFLRSVAGPAPAHSREGVR
jgi:3',5'-cyclic AMP phosphodiesterase CpdA